MFSQFNFLLDLDKISDTQRDFFLGKCSHAANCNWRLFLFFCIFYPYITLSGKINSKSTNQQARSHVSPLEKSLKSIFIYFYDENFFWANISLYIFICKIFSKRVFFGFFRQKLKFLNETLSNATLQRKFLAQLFFYFHFTLVENFYNFFCSGRFQIISSLAFDNWQETKPRNIFLRCVFMWSNRKEKNEVKNIRRESHWLCMLHIGCSLVALYSGGRLFALWIKNTEVKTAPKISFLLSMTGTLLVFRWKIFFIWLFGLIPTQHTRRCRREDERQRERINCVLHFMDTLWCTIHELMHNYTRCVHELGFEKKK